VLTSIVIAGMIALIGLQFRNAFETQQGHIVGVVLVLTGVGFLIWGLLGGGHHHQDHGHGHARHHGQLGHHSHDAHDDEREKDHHDGAHQIQDQRPLVQRLAAIAIPFGAAASPDLTVLPVALAASATGIGVVIGVLVTFSFVTLATFVILTVAATLAGYQIKGEWLEENGTTITAFVLIAIGAAVYVGL
jgi:putative Mn2+ efflux pump MntP